MENSGVEEGGGEVEGGGEEEGRGAEEGGGQNHSVGKQTLKQNWNWGRNGDMQPCQRQCMATIQWAEELKRMRSGKM